MYRRFVDCALNLLFEKGWVSHRQLYHLGRNKAILGWVYLGGFIPEDIFGKLGPRRPPPCSCRDGVRRGSEVVRTGGRLWEAAGDRALEKNCNQITTSMELCWSFVFRKVNVERPQLCQCKQWSMRSPWKTPWRTCSLPIQTGLKHCSQNGKKSTYYWAFHGSQTNSSGVLKF